MHSKFLRPILFFLCFVIFYFIFCIKEKSTPVEPGKPSITNQPVEDTTRVYLMPLSRDTLWIYPKAVFARFYPWVTDTNQIKLVLEKYNLRRYRFFMVFDQQIVAAICVTDNRRAEYHFTPYGKEGFCNFGTDSLVEYSFGVFNNGRDFPTGNIEFRFDDDTQQARIDSLFEANGLRFLYTMPDYPSGKFYRTLITPRAKKNVLDLGYDLQSIPFVRHCGVHMLGGGEGVQCE